jgi:hypothetical protein
MPNITTSIREPPIYRAGLSAGTHIGPRMALDALTGEHVNQDSLKAAHPDFGSPVPALRAYTAACLLAVTKLGRCQVPAGADLQRSGAGPQSMNRGLKFERRRIGYKAPPSVRILYTPNLP